MEQREKRIALIQNAYPNIKIPKIFLICEDHFNKDILRKNVIKDSDGKIIFEVINFFIMSYKSSFYFYIYIFIIIFHHSLARIIKNKIKRWD